MQYKGQILQSTKGQYEKLEKIGEGAYGCVFKAQNLSTKEFVAMKKIKIDLENDGTPQTAIREISIMQQFNHPNIVPIQDFFYKIENKRDCALYIVFEYANYDLHKYIK